MSAVAAFWVGLGLALTLGTAIASEAPAGLAELAEAAGMDAYAVPLKAPRFGLPGLDGEPRGKQNYQGRVVLLNFWASWCPPCREEFPSLERLHQALGGPNFTVLAIAVADTEEGVARFLAGRRPPFDVLLDDDRKTAEAYRAAGVPVTYLLDRQGRLLAGKTGPQDWDRPEMRRLIQEAIRSGP
ncbi:MAG: TlpA family protein disulfide reductase [Gammaproteobacteria bacterium]|jgi:thiol-disulfide isomerase/thioredoxin|nr:TlpA family protein disulfide reductase [Chromatiaceae bacterium]MCU0935392.1 TlpA family protein disulfide reductase [Gammaproteobacteria bacterium]